MNNLKLDKPIPILREQFLQFLKQNKITEFSIKNVNTWYQFNRLENKKVFSKKSAHTIVYKQIIDILLKENRIIRISRGIYEVIKYDLITKEMKQQQKEKDLAAEIWREKSSKGFNPDNVFSNDLLKKLKN